MIRRSARAALAGVLAISSVAGAQPPSDPRLDARLDPSTRSAIVAIVDSARRAGIPTEPLVDRALEGASKRAPSARIVNAVRSLSSDLRNARRALGPASTDAEVKAGAEALRSGIPVQQLEKMRSMRGQQRLAVALSVLTDLVHRGIPADTVTRVMGSLVKVAATDAQILQLRSEVERDMVAGTPGATAVSIRGVELERVVAEASLPANGDASGGGLPSRGTTRSAEGAGMPPVGGAVNASIGAGDNPAGAPARPTAPRGKPKKRP